MLNFCALSNAGGLSAPSATPPQSPGPRLPGSIPARGPGSPGIPPPLRGESGWPARWAGFAGAHAARTPLSLQGTDAGKRRCSGCSNAGRDCALRIFPRPTFPHPPRRSFLPASEPFRPCGNHRHCVAVILSFAGAHAARAPLFCGDASRPRPIWRNRCSIYVCYHPHTS